MALTVSGDVADKKIFNGKNYEFTITKVCKKTVEKKTKEEQVTTTTVQIMHSTVGTTDVNLC